MEKRAMYAILALFFIIGFLLIGFYVKVNIYSKPKIYLSPPLNYNGCFRIDSGGNYNISWFLEENETYMQRCIEIEASNVNLDCQNIPTKLNKSLVLTSTALSIYNSRNITIKNCNISAEDDIGLYSARTSNLDISDIEIRGAYTSIFLFIVQNVSVKNFSIINSTIGTLSSNGTNINFSYGVFDSVKVPLGFSDESSACNQSVFFNNLTDRKGLPILFYNFGVELSDLNLSTLVLCNAWNSNIKNILFNSTNGGLISYWSGMSNYSNLDFRGNNWAFIISESSKNIINKTNIRDVGLGIYLENSDENIVEGVRISNFTEEGLMLDYSDSNLIYKTEISNSSTPGIYLLHSNYNNIGNVSVISTGKGLFIKMSSGNSVNNSVFRENKWFDIDVSYEENPIFSILSMSEKNQVDSFDTYDLFRMNLLKKLTLELSEEPYLANTDKFNDEEHRDSIFKRDVGILYYSDCENQFINVTGSGGRPIGYYSGKTDLSNQIYSSLVLCNADNSNINNITIIGSDILQNNQFEIVNTDNSVFNNINSSNNRIGISLFFGYDNNITLLEAVNNREDGLIIYEGKNNKISNSKIFQNNKSGIYLYNTAGNLIERCNISYNKEGVNFYNAYENNISNSFIFNNVILGANLTFGGNSTIKNSVFSRNQIDIFLSRFSFNNIAGNNFSYTALDSIFITNRSNNNRFVGNKLSNPSNNFIYVFSSEKNIFSNNVVENRPVDKFDIFFGNNTDYNIISGDYNGKFGFTTNGSFLLFGDERYGFIQFDNRLNTTLNNLGSAIRISNNSFGVNPIYPQINVSAIVYVKNSPGYNYSDTYVMRDNSYVCNVSTTPRCEFMTERHLLDPVFRVSGWSNYSLIPLDITAPEVMISYVEVLNETGGIYRINYTVRDIGQRIANCSLYLDNSFYTMASNPPRNSSFVFNTSASSFNYYVNCTDLYNNIGKSDVRFYNGSLLASGRSGPGSYTGSANITQNRPTSNTSLGSGGWPGTNLTVINTTNTTINDSTAGPLGNMNKAKIFFIGIIVFLIVGFIAVAIYLIMYIINRNTYNLNEELNSSASSV